MDGVESGGNRRRRMLKERFGFMGCCRAAWANAFRSHHREQPQWQMDPDPDPGAGMNLAAERRLRGPAEEEGEAPWRVSLMRLLEEDDLDPFFSFTTQLRCDAVAEVAATAILRPQCVMRTAI
ncbi:hypothetical protein Fmac_018107 [Flemingia macrophylla]|uniref:Uncharacterized protein n=1 Tax=Flemingia macrophylla TaxID=520843 RepID=A0ABD1M473_9FABA